jgi:hypothetical protein
VPWRLTLNQDVYVMPEARDVPDAAAALGERHPHLAVIDIDIGEAQLMQQN